MAAGVPAGIAGEVLGGGKERHDVSIARGLVESLPNMPWANRIFARFRAIELARDGLQLACTVRGVNLSLRIVWRRVANFAKHCGLLVKWKNLRCRLTH
jgi:hypothetical protein